MRTLEYNVTGQLLEKSGDHEGLVAGTRGYLRAHFSFDDDWVDCVKVASFWSDGIEHAVMLKDDACEIPPEVLLGLMFEVAVEGRKKGYRILSRKIKERQVVRN